MGKDLLYVNVFRKNDARTIYNVIYRDGKNGVIMMKRCAITGITRDKDIPSPREALIHKSCISAPILMARLKL